MKWPSSRHEFPSEVTRGSVRASLLQKLDDPLPTSPQEDTEHFLQTVSFIHHTAIPHAGSTIENGTQKRKEAEKLESWPLASRFGLWKISFGREVMSGSVHPKLVVQWLAESDHAANMDCLDHS